MAITAITIENFKGIGEPVRIDLKPITLLFGSNSAGKSTLVQALHYAREIFEHQNINVDKTDLGGNSIDLGGFKSLVHNHDLSLPVTIRFDLDLKNEDLPRYMEGFEDFGLHEWQEFDLWEIPNGSF
jgi:Predicted ATPases